MQLYISNHTKVWYYYHDKNIHFSQTLSSGFVRQTSILLSVYGSMRFTANMVHTSMHKQLELKETCFQFCSYCGDGVNT